MVGQWANARNSGQFFVCVAGKEVDGNLTRIGLDLVIICDLVMKSNKRADSCQFDVMFSSFEKFTACAGQISVKSVCFGG